MLANNPPISGLRAVHLVGPLSLLSVYPLGCSLSILPEHLREMDRLRNGTPDFDMEPVVRGGARRWRRRITLRHKLTEHPYRP